jgi:methionyl-tRNA formyltransferase
MALRLAFMGSPAFSVGVLAEIVAAGHDVACVYSQPPKPAGRGQTLTQTPVHSFAQSLGIEVRTPRSLRKEPEQEAFAALDLDVAVVVAYGLILPKPILGAPRRGCLNLHASLLPRWRGAAPIQRAIMAGDSETGAQVMQMEEGLDTGPILMSESTAIGPRDTAQSLHDKLAGVGASLMVRALSALERDSLTPQTQSEDGAVYAAKLTNDEARIDWTRSAQQIDWHVRGLSPFPGAWFTLYTPKGPVRMKALFSQFEPTPAPVNAAPGTLADDRFGIVCGDGQIVRLLQVQREGKSATSAEDFLRGQPLRQGLVLS